MRHSARKLRGKGAILGVALLAFGAAPQAGAETVAPLTLVTASSETASTPDLIRRFELRQAAADAAMPVSSPVDEMRSSLAVAALALQNGLAHGKDALDRATRDLIERAGLDELGLTPERTYGIALGILAGAYLADALGGNGLMTVGLAGVGGYVGGGVAAGRPVLD